MAVARRCPRRSRCGFSGNRARCQRGGWPADVGGGGGRTLVLRSFVHPPARHAQDHLSRVIGPNTTPSQTILERPCRRATPKSHKTFISCAAPHQGDLLRLSALLTHRNFGVNTPNSTELALEEAHPQFKEISSLLQLIFINSCVGASRRLGSAVGCHPRV